MAEQQVPPAPRYDPARVTEVSAAGGLLECVLLLRRAVFVYGDERISQEMAPVASVALSWPVAKQLRDLLAAQVQNHEAEHGPIKALGEPQWQAKPH